ncbi:hypothetical protein HZ326_4893 [Fusarium oxysporum f. sp. albedinis]|jgi:hypothetical protein|nr:hypothetical protein HZ326_4893 [Fusarium oxysporum f. sp. albedinis]
MSIRHTAHQLNEQGRGNETFFWMNQQGTVKQGKERQKSNNVSAVSSMQWQGFISAFIPTTQQQRYT